jgi:hypothetical protein
LILLRARSVQHGLIFARGKINLEVIMFFYTRAHTLRAQLAWSVARWSCMFAGVWFASLIL